MVYVIGDIHGELSKLRNLVECITAQDFSPSFVFIGDYLDKGENPLQVILYLVKLSSLYNCTFLWGNHEYLWLEMKGNEANNYLSKYGAGQTQKAFDGLSLGKVRKEMMVRFKESFFEKFLPYFQYGKYIIVHSGIPPSMFNTPPELIPMENFLFNRYEFINHCSNYMGNKQVVFGHTAFYEPFYDGYKIGIDTGACFLENQPLTAFNADKEYFINSKNEKKHMMEINPNHCPNIIRNKPWRTAND